MANPGSRMDATYARAMAAFQEGAFDRARQLTVEILTEDPGHAGARALRTRIDSRLGAGRASQTPIPGAGRSTRLSGRGNVPEATSVDPTMLIDRADRQPPEYIEPTVVIQREDLSGYRTRQEPTPPPPQRPSHHEVPQPTVLIPPKPRNSATARGGRSSKSFLKGLWPRPQSEGRETGRRRTGQPGAGFWTPTTRGIVMATGGLVVASVFVLGVVALVQRLGAASHTLRITKPANGTIRGAGLECGTRGSDCEVAVKAGSAVELEAVPDEKYAFSGYTGDCPDTGRFTMTQARTCGARFGAAGPADAGLTWPLTITKPTGGTILVAGGIVCGTSGDTCSMKLPDGVPVTLVPERDSGFDFVAFTGDCEVGGETKMTGPRTCGATFIKVEGPQRAQNTAPPKENPPAPPPITRGATARPTPAPAAGNANPAPVQEKPSIAPPVTPPPTPPSTPVPVTVAPTPTPPSTTAPATPADTEEQHAKKEIDALVKKYCAAFETLDPKRIQALFPLANTDVLKNQFKNYKSLQCSVTPPLEYDRFDVNGAGGAQVRFGMKQTIVMKVGGAPSTSETNVRMRVARADAQKPWLIDQVDFAVKPPK